MFYINKTYKDGSNQVFIVSDSLKEAIIQKIKSNKDIIKLDIIKQPQTDGIINVIETLYESAV